MIKLTRVVVVFLFLMVIFPFIVFALQADIQPVRPEFKSIDVDKGGSINAEEVQEYQAKKFNELDQDKNGVLDAKELKADETQSFAKADKDKDGKVTREEANAQFKEYFNGMDANKDAKVSEEEFTQYWPIVVHY